MSDIDFEENKWIFILMAIGVSIIATISLSSKLDFIISAFFGVFTGTFAFLLIKRSSLKDQERFRVYKKGD